MAGKGLTGRLRIYNDEATDHGSNVDTDVAKWTYNGGSEGDIKNKNLHGPGLKAMERKSEGEKTGVPCCDAEGGGGDVCTLSSSISSNLLA